LDEELTIGWRKVAVRISGPENGYPVFLLHGTPGSRLSIRPADSELAEVGVRLITYDRPGYGRSDAYPGRVVAQAADDVRAIADAKGLETFAVLGRSGGGPHALACAALIPERVERVASLVSLAPYGAADLDWLAGMNESNQRQYTAAIAGRAALHQMLFPIVVALRANPNLFGDRLFASADDDHEILVDPGYHENWLIGIIEAVERSLEGWAADNLAFTRPWGFEPAKIRVPTLLWHGVLDVFSPVAHAHWLATQIRHATLLLSQQSSHLHAVAAQSGALRWLVHGGRPEAWPGLAASAHALSGI
jgi:pimeloyl-ACP methyl ester carboxylesterase